MGLLACLKNLGAKPQVVYAAREGSWSGKYVQQRLKGSSLQLRTMLSHAAIVESIRGHYENAIQKVSAWPLQILVGAIYYDKLVLCMAFEEFYVQMTPNDARQPKNEVFINQNLNRSVERSRLYYIAKVGGLARVFQKQG